MSASNAGCDHAHHQQLDADPNRSALISARRLDVVRQGKTLLQHVDIDLHDNEIVTLIGPNGAGKTTLVKALLGLEAIDGGILFKRPHLTVGYVPQRFAPDQALPISVGRFLRLGLKATRDEVKQKLDDVAAPHVYETLLHHISGGELQRVLLARALLRRPDLLVLDEPAQGVDLAGEAELYNLISKIADRYALSVLLVSHDLHTVMARSDRVICLNHHVCCSGVPEAVSKHPEYMRLFGAAAARSIALYRHEHDHHHDLSGAPAEPETKPDEGRR